MSKLVDIRVNINYTKSKEGVMIKNTELIFLSVVPSYKYENEKIERFLDLKESRFELTGNDFDALIKALNELKNITENDLI